MIPGRRAITCVAILSGALAACALHPAAAETIIDEWQTVKVPPPPAIKPVTVDSKTTALLMLDFNQQTCNMERRPRCVAAIPKVKPLLAAARQAGVPVAFTLGGGGTRADMAKEILPVDGEPVVSSGLDKFVNTDLETFLKTKGVQTVIVVGAAAHGAVLYTVSGAVARGFKAIVPVDGMAADLPYAEQYTAWHLANAPIISNSVTLTTLDKIKF